MIERKYRDNGSSILYVLRRKAIEAVKLSNGMNIEGSRGRQKLKKRRWDMIGSDMNRAVVSEENAGDL